VQPSLLRSAGQGRHAAMQHRMCILHRISMVVNRRAGFSRCCGRCRWCALSLVCASAASRPSANNMPVEEKEKSPAIRSYLTATITPALLTALVELDKEERENPVQWLADYLERSEEK